MLENLFFQIVPFLVMISVLVTIHELGHYWVARACGVFVHTFSVGFGKTLWSYQDKRGVIWKIGMIPLGGYVRMASLDLLDYKKEMGEISDERYEELKPLTMEGQSPLKRIAIAAAGPFMNIIFAFVMMAGLLLYGYPGAKITCVVPQSPAADFGLVIGDKLSSVHPQQPLGYVEGKPLSFQAYLHKNNQKQLINIEKGNVNFSACNPNGEITSQPSSASIGVVFNPSAIRDFSKGFSEVIGEAGAIVNLSFTNFIKSFSSFILGIFVKTEEPSQVGGVIAVQKNIAVISKVSLWFYLVSLAELSLTLAWFNLLPIPILDGGHILMASIEGVARKRLSAQKRNFISIIGLAFILFLFILLVKIDLFG